MTSKGAADPVGIARIDDTLFDDSELKMITQPNLPLAVGPRYNKVLF
jgi:hypothetical protein